MMTQYEETPLKHHCKICGKPCFKRICFLCKKKKLEEPLPPKPDPRISFFKSLGTISIKERAIPETKRGKGVIELKEEFNELEE